jgi:hypothetical protein
VQSKIWIASACVLTVLALGGLTATPTTAFHGSWWKGSGTAVSSQGATFNVEFFWGGQDTIIACGGGGCQGSGDGKITLKEIGGSNTVGIPFLGTEDVRNILFTNDATICPSQVSWPDPLEVTPNYSLQFTTGSLTGIQRNCLSTGINHNDFTGNFLDFTLAIHAEGPFGVAHG